MKDATRQEAVELINSKPNVLVVFTSDRCPVCQKFIPEVLGGIESEMPHLEMLKVNSTAEKQMFGPDVFPSVYAFKDGNRIDWVKGSAPIDVVRQKLLELFPTKAE